MTVSCLDSFYEEPKKQPGWNKRILTDREHELLIEFIKLGYKRRLLTRYFKISKQRISVLCRSQGLIRPKQTEEELLERKRQSTRLWRYKKRSMLLAA